MLVLAGLAQLRGVHIFINKIARYHKNPQTERNMVNCLFLFYAIHFILLGMINDGDNGAHCELNNEYPVVFQYYFAVWLCVFCLNAYFYFNDFFMDEDLIKKQDEKDVKFEN